jgi:hypothetical protein
MRFGSLTFIKKTPDRWRGNVVALWQCDCGAKKKIPLVRVKDGRAKSCGCLKEKHGACKAGNRTAEYLAWQAMHSRCRAKLGHRDYDAYVAKGIDICPRWAIYKNFLADMGKRPSHNHSLGRIDNNLGYSPENCRWETPTQQMRNTKKSRVWFIKGRIFESLRQAGEHFSVNSKTIWHWAMKQQREDCYVINRY